MLANDDDDDDDEIAGAAASDVSPAKRIVRQRLSRSGCRHVIDSEQRTGAVLSASHLILR